VLDNFATVAEAVAALEKEPFYIAAPMTPDGHAGTAHLSISDPTGDSAVFEYLGGRLVIHHGREFQVMTNSPPFDQQIALNAYWENIGGLTMLPGTNRAADRFVRASFYVNAIPQTADNSEALASAFGVIRNVSVPIGISTPTSLTSPRPSGGRRAIRRTWSTTSNRPAAPTSSGCRWRRSISPKVYRHGGSG
jgi:choloylglycine hydrolase